MAVISTSSMLVVSLLVWSAILVYHLATPIWQPQRHEKQTLLQKTSLHFWKTSYHFKLKLLNRQKYWFLYHFRSCWIRLSQISKCIISKMKQAAETKVFPVTNDTYFKHILKEKPCRINGFKCKIFTRSFKMLYYLIINPNHCLTHWRLCKPLSAVRKPPLKYLCQP